MNDIIKTINNRKSLRKFSEKEIKIEEEKAIIQSALRAPTAGNLMLYSMIVIKNKEILKKLSVSCDNQPFIASAKMAIIFLSDYQRLCDYFEMSNVKEYRDNNNLSYDYPELSDLLLGTEDAITAVQNTVIAAESIDIGSCYFGDIIENYEFHRNY